MDALDILAGKFYQIHTGTYYGKLPIASSNDSATAIYAQAQTSATYRTR